MASMTTRKCKCCGKEFLVRTADVNRAGEVLFEIVQSCSTGTEHRTICSLFEPMRPSRLRVRIWRNYSYWFHLRLSNGLIDVYI